MNITKTRGPITFSNLQISFCITKNILLLVDTIKSNSKNILFWTVFVKEIDYVCVFFFCIVQNFCIFLGFCYFYYYSLCLIPFLDPNCYYSFLRCKIELLLKIGLAYKEDIHNSFSIGKTCLLKRFSGQIWF